MLGHWGRSRAAPLTSSSPMRIVASLPGGLGPGHSSESPSRSRRPRRRSRRLLPIPRARTNRSRIPVAAPCSASGRRCCALFGGSDEAQALAAEGPRARPEARRVRLDAGPMLKQVARQARLREQVRELRGTGAGRPWKDAALAAAEGTSSQAADLLRRDGRRRSRRSPALCAEELIGRQAAEPRASRAPEGADFYRTVGATRYIQQGENAASRFRPRRASRLVSLAGRASEVAMLRKRDRRW